MKTNYTTLDQGRIDRIHYARMIRVEVAPGSYEYVVAVYQDSGKPDHGPILYVSAMRAVEHFADETEASQYFLALMDPLEFGDPISLLPTLKSRIPSKAFHWTPSMDVARKLAAASFRREVAHYD